MEKHLTDGNSMKQRKLTMNQVIDGGIFVIMLLAVSIITFSLFYRQCVESMFGSGLFHSDMKAYILEMQGLDSGYSFPYPVLFKLAAFFHLFVSPECAMALATMVLNSGAIVVTKMALNHLFLPSFKELFPRWKWLAGGCITVVSVSLFFISMLYPLGLFYLPGIHYNYLGVFTANPFHNATYMAARPFAILAFLWYVKLLDVYEDEEKVSGKDYILFSLFLLLATMTKPSFTIVLVGAAGLIMLFRLFVRKFRNFKGTLFLGLTFLPTFIDLLYQYQGVFVPTEGAEGGIGFCFGNIWRLYCSNIVLAICLGVGFPLLVLLLHFKELKTNTLFRFSWQVYLMSFAMAFFLYEKGFRAPDFNFSWGYMYGIFFAFFGSVCLLLSDTVKKKKPLLLLLQWGALGVHLLCGLIYFYGIFRGQMYY